MYSTCGSKLQVFTSVGFSSQGRGSGSVYGEYVVLQGQLVISNHKTQIYDG